MRLRDLKRAYTTCREEGEAEEKERGRGNPLSKNGASLHASLVTRIAHLWFRQRERERERDERETEREGAEGGEEEDPL